MGQIQSFMWKESHFALPWWVAVFLLFLAGCRASLEKDELQLVQYHCNVHEPSHIPEPFDSVSLERQIRRVRTHFGDNSGISMIVFTRDEHLFEYYDGHADLDHNKMVDANTVFPIASSTKSLVAALVLKLVEEGRLDLDRPIGEYLNGFEFDHWRLSANDITLRKLLSHDTGISSKALEIRTSMTGDFDNDVLRALYSDAGYSWFTPQYSNLNYILIGLILEEATGQSWQTLLKTKVIEPLGMDRAFTNLSVNESNVAFPHTLDTLRQLYMVPKEVNTLQNNTITPAGGILASARSLSRYVQMVLNCGWYNDEHFLTESSIKASLTPQAKNKGGGFHDYFAFGLGWELARHDSLELVTHGGSNKTGVRAYMGFSPELGVGLILLSNENILVPYVHGAISRYIWDALRNKEISLEKLDENLKNWTDNAQNRFEGRMEEREYSIFDFPTLPEDIPASDFAGTFANSEFGEATVVAKNAGVQFIYGNLHSLRSIRITDYMFVVDFGLFSQQVNFESKDGMVYEMEFQGMGISFERTR